MEARLSTISNKEITTGDSAVSGLLNGLIGGAAMALVIALVQPGLRAGFHLPDLFLGGNTRSPAAGAADAPRGILHLRDDLRAAAAFGPVWSA